MLHWKEEKDYKVNTHAGCRDAFIHNPQAPRNEKRNYEWNEREEELCVWFFFRDLAEDLSRERLSHEFIICVLFCCFRHSVYSGKCHHCPIAFGISCEDGWGHETALKWLEFRQCGIFLEGFHGIWDWELDLRGLRGVKHWILGFVWSVRLRLSFLNVNYCIWPLSGTVRLRLLMYDIYCIWRLSGSVELSWFAYGRQLLHLAAFGFCKEALNTCERELKTQLRILWKTKAESENQQTLDRLFGQAKCRLPNAPTGF